MNEKIVELAEQAGRESFDSELTSLLQVSTEHNMYEVPAGFIAKFAELLVRECASLAYDGPGGILEHFGVEE